MAEANSPNFGPYRKLDSVASFDNVSEEALAWFDERVHAEQRRISRPIYHLFLRMAYQAKTTSLSARLANSWAMSLPALALLRVRLEQLIVCSFLIHEDEEKGLKPFVSYISVTEYKGLKSALSNSKIAGSLTKMDLEKFKAEAIEAHEDVTPGFFLEGDNFQRSWTKLDLRSMARRRDTLVAARNKSADNSLEQEYVSIYKTACSVVHADASSLSFRYLDIFHGAGSQSVLMAHPDWALIVAASMALYDLLQYHEILEYLGISDNTGFRELMERWIVARDRFIR